MTRPSSGRPWILFDIGGVLEIVDDDEWPQTVKRGWADALGLPIEEVQARLAAADLPRIDIRTGVEQEYWRRIGSALDAGEDDVQRMRADFWDAYCGRANTELIDFARALRERAGLAILSNSGDGAREEEEQRFGFSALFDPICYSHEQGVLKPDPAAYERALEKMQTTPDQVFFIDDRVEAIEVALQCGIRGAVHRDNASTIAAIERFLAGRAPSIASAGGRA